MRITETPGDDGIAAAWTEWRGKKAGKEGEILLLLAASTEKTPN
jgi:hypothetical protein